MKEHMRTVFFDQIDILCRLETTIVAASLINTTTNNNNNDSDSYVAQIRKCSKCAKQAKLPC